MTFDLFEWGCPGVDLQDSEVIQIWREILKQGTKDGVTLRSSQTLMVLWLLVSSAG